MAALNIVLLLLALCAAAEVGRRLPARQGRPPVLTLSFLGVLVLCLIIQEIHPAFLYAFRRDAAAVAHGQIYRLFTALWFQDSGIAGGLFNLLVLAVLGLVTEKLWARWAWLTLYFFGGLLAEAIALAWRPIGAGNSVAYMSLAGSVLVLGLRDPTRPGLRVLAAFGLTVALLASFVHDIHGAALLLGAAMGFTFCLRVRAPMR